MAIRTIDTSGMDPVDTKVKGRPEVAFVLIKDIIIDERYQRSLERTGLRNVRKIALNFDWAKFSPVMLSRRENGQYAIIDGQHRTHAAALCGISEVPAMVSDLSIEEEAAAFSWINGAVTALTGNQIFKAALAAFEPWAVQCNSVVERAGCKLMTYNAQAASKRPGQVFCIGMVRRMVEAGHSNELFVVLSGILQSRVQDDVRYYNGFGLSALVPAVIAASVKQPAVVTAFLNEHDLDEVARMVSRVQELPENKGRSFKALFASSVTVLLKQHLKAQAK
ncbi:DUF6551 family protein [Sulfitobacter pontiacus]|uniref:DUF6551 family protein n=1 Tax=Sulfitobacter pontiacus TaxID=60137 RepID=UPI002AC97724|nr:DUF6551 family protein [Sulfitobacter pontiacus]WPZ24877.1 DUF6551 family protein [Sulfitobacter pontiacus]|tara:strand:+ start:824 stop:1660 length:837 start_codon:yes stop_codon:yes gene_type:complete